LRGRTAETIALLERAAGAALAGAYARASAAERHRRRVLERSLRARQRLAVRPVWTAFACISLSNHMAANASEASALLARSRSLLDAGRRLAKEKARWGAARVGLMRRAARAAAGHALRRRSSE
jgi:Zn-dependent oligopeptidase